MDVIVIAASCCRDALDDDTAKQLRNQKFIHMAAQELEIMIEDALDKHEDALDKHSSGDGGGGGMGDAAAGGGGGGGVLPTSVKVGAGSEKGGRERKDERGGGEGEPARATSVNVPPVGRAHPIL